MTVSVLDVEGRVAGRGDELEQLASALDAAGRRGGECVLVSGEPGVGKSTLLQVFGAQVVGRDGVFAYGRFREGARAPYSALGEALGVLVSAMDAMPAGERTRWRADLDRIVSAASGAANELRALVPELRPILETGSEAEPDAADGRPRLQRAVVRLVTAAAAYRPLALAVDDLQWADRDSISLFAELRAASIRNVLLVGAHRTGEFDPGARDLVADDVRRLDLVPLSRQEVEVLLAAVCGPGSELGDVAAEFHGRTGGNPLHVRQLLRRAQQTGALTHSADRRRPVWDLRILGSIEITADVAELLGRAIDRLPPVEAELLGALACIGREFDLADAEVAAALPAEVVARSLWSALDLRLVEAVDSRGRRIDQVIDRATHYRFSHDRVSEVAQARLAAADRLQVHLRLGRSLAAQGEDRLFDAARHAGLGGLVSTDGGERARFAEVQRRAAAKARAQASFPLALESSRVGLALLGDRRWVDHPALARTLLLGAAEAAFLVSDTTLLRALLDEAALELSEPADRARLALLQVKGRVAEHRLQEALEAGLRALEELGEPLPRHTGKAHALGVLVRMKLLMRRWTDERLLGLPRCTDQRVAEIQRILDELHNLSYIVRPQLFPFLVRKKLELTVMHGLVPSSPVAIASYGVLLVMTGDHVGSQRFGEIGLRLADRKGFHSARPQTQFLHLNFIRPWRHSMRDALPQLLDAFNEALSSGDPESAGFIGAVVLYQSFMVGRPLPEIDALAQAVIPEIRSHRTTSLLCRATQQMVLNLMGRSEDPFLLAGESGYDEREVLPAARRENDVVALSGAAIQKLILHFWCGDDAGGLPFAEEVERHLAGLVGTPNVQLYYMINALSRVRLAPRDRATVQAVRQSLALHRKWAAAAPANYAAAHALIEGVWARAQGDLRWAEQRLEQAIGLADEHGLPAMGALAHEEAAELHAQTGRVALSRHMLQSAHERWVSLGVTVRSTRLERSHPWLLGHDVVRSGTTTIDPLGVHRLIQALPAATTLRSLTEVLLGAVATISGAARVLLLRTDLDGTAIRAVHEAGTTRMVDPRVDDVVAGVFDRTLVGEAARRGQPVSIAVGVDGDRRVHTYERGAIAVPVVLRGRTVATVYADFGGVGVLRPAQEEALIALCAQAAAPLWSFELEDRLHEAEEHQRSLIDAQSRFIPSELLRILDIDDIRRVRRGHRVERRLTVLISDIRGYTTLLESMDVAEASELALGFLRAVEVPIITNNGLLQDVRGDEVLAVFDTQPDHAVSAGLAILRSLRDHNRERVARGTDELRVGIGINTGTVALGLVGGVNRMALTVIGDAVNLASRVESTTKRYGANLLISDETYAQLADRDRFAIRRMERTQVINRRRPVTIYEVYDDDPEPLRAAKRAAQPVFDEAFALLDAGDVQQARQAFERCRALLPADPVAPLHLAHCDAVDRGEATGSAVVLLQK
jgi:predicted ATPase/class 3 adenylate cyclase